MKNSILKRDIFTWKFKHLQKLLGESSALDRVGRFLGALPDFMVREGLENICYSNHHIKDTISILHNATTAGIVPVVQELMSSERLALSRDQYGATPLHKAVLFYQPKLVKLISEKFPLTTKVRRIKIINKFSSPFSWLYLMNISLV